MTYPFSLITGTLTMRLPDRPDPLPYEWFTISVNPDASRTLRVVTVSPDASLVRDSSQVHDASWAPLEGYLRLIRDGELFGSLVRKVEGGTVRSYYFDGEGRVTQGERDVLEGMTFGFHSVAANPWKFAQHTGAPGPQPLPVLTHSLTWNGGTVGLGEVSSTELELVGKETITVPAGTFECDHYVWSTEVDGVIEVWTTGEERIYVRGHQHTRDIVYELASLDRAQSGAPVAAPA